VNLPNNVILITHFYQQYCIVISIALSLVLHVPLQFLTDHITLTIMFQQGGHGVFNPIPMLVLFGLCWFLLFTVSQQREERLWSNLQRWKVYTDLLFRVQVTYNSHAIHKTNRWTTTKMILNIKISTFKHQLPKS